MTELVVAALDDAYAEMGELADRFLNEASGGGFHVVVFAGGRKVVDAASGTAITADLHPVASVSKGIAGLAVAHLVERELLDLGIPVAHYWPEFGTRGKAGITVAAALSHQAGLLRFPEGLTFDEMTGGEGAAALAGMGPAWNPGTAHGYHAFTIGTLTDELVRRVTGLTTAAYFSRVYAAGRNLEFWLQLSDDLADRIRPVVPPVSAEHAAPASFGTLAGDAGTPFRALDDAEFWLNSMSLVRAGIPSVSGVGNARGLAGAYAAAIGADGGSPLFSRRTLDEVTRIHAAGWDLVLQKHTRYGVLFQKPDPDFDFGTADAFGHDGAGGCLGFADPRTGTAFGFLTDQVPTPSRADHRAIAFAQLVRRIATSER